MNGIALTQHEVESRVLGNRRAVWVQPPASGEASGLCVFLDGEYYLPHLRAAPILDRLVRDGSVPPLAAIYVSTIDGPTRWAESFCNPEFVEFLAEELLPFAAREVGVEARAADLLAGLSLSGLAAAHAALLRPELFPRVVCQSASFWWEDLRILETIEERGAPGVSFRISVGNEEMDENVDHGDGLIQVVSQLESNRRTRDALVGKSADVIWSEFDGGHAIAPWREELPEALASLFGNASG